MTRNGAHFQIRASKYKMKTKESIKSNLLILSTMGLQIL